MQGIQEADAHIVTWRPYGRMTMEMFSRWSDSPRSQEGDVALARHVLHMDGGRGTWPKVTLAFAQDDMRVRRRLLMEAICDGWQELKPDEDRAGRHCFAFGPETEPLMVAIAELGLLSARTGDDGIAVGALRLLLSLDPADHRGNIPYFAEVGVVAPTPGMTM